MYLKLILTVGLQPIIPQIIQAEIEPLVTIKSACKLVSYKTKYFLSIYFFYIELVILRRMIVVVKLTF